MVSTRWTREAIGPNRRPYGRGACRRARRAGFGLAVLVLSLQSGAVAQGDQPASRGGERDGGETVRAQTKSVPPGFLELGRYPLVVLGGGSMDEEARDPSLVVSTRDGYRQTLRLPYDVIQVRLSHSEDREAPHVFLEELVLNGVRFRAPQPVLYRPRDRNGVLIPLQRWEWTLRSDRGGATLTQSSIAQPPEFEPRDGVPVLVQRVDSTITFGGSVSGTVTFRQWEAVDDPQYMRQEAQGSVAYVTNGITYR